MELPLLISREGESETKIKRLTGSLFVFEKPHLFTGYPSFDIVPHPSRAKLLSDTDKIIWRFSPKAIRRLPLASSTLKKTLMREHLIVPHEGDFLQHVALVPPLP